MRRSSGLTLLEFTVTLAILAVLVTLALPSFRASLERQRISAALFLLSAQFASARMTAISSRDVVTLCPLEGTARCRSDSDWSAGWLMFRGRRRTAQPEEDDVILRVVPRPLHASLHLHSSQGRRALHFDPDGRSSGSNLRMRVCLDGRLRGEVVVNNLGRVRSRRLPGWQGCWE